MNPMNRRLFAGRLAAATIGGAMFQSEVPLLGAGSHADDDGKSVLNFPGPWAFGAPKGQLILVSDQQLEDLQNPDKEVDLSLTSTPNKTTLRQVCRQIQAAGGTTVMLAFDHFFAQYRPGAAKRQLLPDTDGYIERVANMGKTLREHDLGFELSLLSPLELGAGYRARTGETGRWVQYREGIRDPKTGRYEVQLWEHRKWTNNKGSIEVKRVGIRVFAFNERRLGSSPFNVVLPDEIVELGPPSRIESWEGSSGNAGDAFAATRLCVSGAGDASAGNRTRVLVVLTYETPEMDYFSAKTAPFLKDLVDRYHQAGVPLNGLYADEMHIQQDWAYHSHHDEGQFTLRFYTPAMGRAFAAEYGAEYADFEKFFVYFAYGQHGFLPGLDARIQAQHVLGPGADDVHRTFLLRRRYYELLSRTVVGHFAAAKAHAEKIYGHELEARAHATWAQSPTIDRWENGSRPSAPRQYEYTSNFAWANTVQQSAAACDDYFKWNDFLTGGGNDHTEGGWLDRNYFALALACSTGVLNKTPYAYAAHWGMPPEVGERRQALVEAYGASASPPFQAVQDSEHREIDVLMLYPMSLVSAEERFGSWMVQFGYANFITSEVLVARARISADGLIEVAGRRYSTLVALFEIVPAPGLISFIEAFLQRGGRVIWSGPPPRFELTAQSVLPRWKSLFGIQELSFQQEGWMAPGETIRFVYNSIPSQTVLTHFLVDHVYPVEPAQGTEVFARLGERTVGVRRSYNSRGTSFFLGFRPRDDQSASLGEETRTWFAILRAVGAYPSTDGDPEGKDHPAVVSRSSPWLACSFPNGALSIALHLKHHQESWPGGFQRNPEADAKIMQSNPLSSDRLELRNLKLNGRTISYDGRLVVSFRTDSQSRLIAFSGYNASSITLNGVENRFASRPMPFVAWAPVTGARRKPGGAVVEFWVQGEGELRIPLPEGVTRVRVAEGSSRRGIPGNPAPSRVENGLLVFEAASPAGRRYGYVLPV